MLPSSWVGCFIVASKFLPGMGGGGLKVGTSFLYVLVGDCGGWGLILDFPWIKLSLEDSEASRGCKWGLKVDGICIGPSLSGE